MTLKFKIHSFVDVITNSSTVIYVYQDDINVAKQLVQEILNLMNVTDKTPDDVFYYGVFCENETYLEKIDDLDDDEIPEGFIKLDWGSDNEELIENLKLSIIKGEIEKPEWMSDIEDGGDWFDPDRYLHLIPKDEKFTELGEKMKEFLSSPEYAGDRDG